MRTPDINAKPTNIERQYLEIRKQVNPEYLIFFQIGDFFELYNEDAEKIHKATGIILTARGSMPMAGVPCRHSMSYIRKLVFEYGYTIALCEQTEQGNGLMDRKITKICTKGTVYDEFRHDYNLVMAIHVENNFSTIVYGDISTSEVFIETIPTSEIASHVNRIEAIKVLCNKNIDADYEIIQSPKNYEASIQLSFSEQSAFNILMEFFTSKGYEMKPFIYRGAINTMYLHANTLQNLEVFHDIHGNINNSLFSVINFTNTPMGYRLLQQQLKYPSMDINYLNNHLNSVEKMVEFLHQRKKLNINVGDIMRNLNNLNSINALKRLAVNIENARKLIAICFDQSILPNSLINIYESSKQCGIGVHLHHMLQDDSFSNIPAIQDLNEKKNEILSHINNLPSSLNIDAVIENNSQIGFFFKSKEIINSKDFLPQKAIKSAYRYTHAQLLKYEKDLEIINTEIEDQQNKVISSLAEYCHEHRNEISQLSIAIAQIDVIYSKAQAAYQYDWIKPVFTNNELCIKNGCNPILQKFKTLCIKNDLILENQKTLILTGANMGGKSTYLKQNAMIILMAQIGSFVPASEAKLPIMSGLFVRMGANDDIFSNSSTFFVEMKECALFLKKASANSFIVLDEIGRGTSYKEGISLSQALCEYITNTLRSFCLISTHYLELPDALKSCSGIIYKQASYTVSHDDIVFLYRIVNGIASSSHSIHTAKIAGIPVEILNRATELNNTV